jgi:hypothetical protein
VGLCVGNCYNTLCNCCNSDIQQCPRILWLGCGCACGWVTTVVNTTSVCMVALTYNSAHAYCGLVVVMRVVGCMVVCVCVVCVCRARG